MATYKAEKNWTDLQESLNRVRQQLGLIPRAEWDNLVSSNPPLHVHLTSQRDGRKVHSPSNLPKIHTNLRRISHLMVPPLFNGKPNDKKETLRKQALSQRQPSSVPDAATVLSSDLPLEEHPTSSFVREGHSFAWNFVNSFILEMLQDELVPDTLMEVLSDDANKCAPAYSPTGKNFDIKGKLPQTLKPAILKQLPAVSILDTLLEEAVGEMTVGLIRRVIEKFVKNCLSNTAIDESVTELIAETIEPMVPWLVKEAVSETLEGILQENILSEVLDEEMRNIAVLLLSEYDTETCEEQQQAMRTNADMRLLAVLLQENLLKILGNQGRRLPEKIELDRLLDSWKLNVLFRQYLYITQHDCLFTKNVALKDYHRKAFTDVEFLLNCNWWLRGFKAVGMNHFHFTSHHQ
ncbi:uncharacterized protein LOC125467025 isoform X2 [Stegostoma tigrinum]|uniref:uncharacterized protein LOC125467025 isoform X2 n=1 Tax=Stegostoma tigrinum TaxID=3053191 RepID=UPI0028704209|nr:uncharacterized protein LOC125467025 isoform X2 [Stegostoma tigrinum]